MSQTSLSASGIQDALRVLKAMFRAKGLSYADIAAAMGKSESSLKRYLTGRRLTLYDLEEMCGVLGIRLGEFYELAGREMAAKADTLTQEQETALGQAPELLIVLVLLMQGWSATETARELGTDATGLFPWLMRLERLGLIKVYPGNRVRTLVGSALKLRKGSPVRKGADEVLKEAFANMQFGREEKPWSMELVKLSSESLEQLRAMSAAFGAQVRALAERDRKAGSDGEWCFHLSAALAVDLPQYLRKVKKTGEDGAT